MQETLNNKINILLIPSWYPPNGGGFFKAQAERITEYAHTVSVIYVEEWSLKQIFKINPLDLIRVRVKQEGALKVYRTKFIRLPYITRFNFRYRHMMFMRVAKVFIKENTIPDISHVHSTVWGGYAALKLYNKHNIPYVITEHRGRFNAKNKLIDDEIAPWFPKYMTPILESVKRVIPVTKYQIEGLQNCSSKPIDPAKFTVIPNIFEPSFEIPNLGKKEHNNSDKTIFLCVAVFETYKNHELLIEACLLLLKKGYTNFEFLLAGKGVKQAHIESLVTINQLSEHITFMGYCSKETLIELYSKTDFMVLTSLSEGQPVAIIESFAMGVPVIVPDLVTDDVVNKENSLVFETANATDLCTKLIESFALKGSYNAAKLNKYAMDNFSSKALVPKIINVYKEVLTKHGD